MAQRNVIAVTPQNRSRTATEMGAGEGSALSRSRRGQGNFGFLKAFVRVFALAPDCHTGGRYQRVWQRHFYDGLQAPPPTAARLAELARAL